MQYFVLPAIVTATGLLAGAAPVNKEETGIQPLAPPATRPGAPLVLQWNPDVSGSKDWKHMSISLVSVGQDGHEKTTKLASNIDGTNPSKTNYTTEAPKHPKNSNVYFVEFSDGKTKKKSPHFTIENADSSYHVRRHAHSETPGAVPDSELYSESNLDESTAGDSMRPSDLEALNLQDQDESSVNGQRAADHILSPQGQLGGPVNIGGIMYVPLVPTGMLESLVRDHGHARPTQSTSNNTASHPNSTSSGSATRTPISADRNMMAHFESEGQQLIPEGLRPTSTSGSSHATESVTSSPETSSHRGHSTKSANATATGTKTNHASKTSHKSLEDELNSASLPENSSSRTGSLASATGTRAASASPTSALSATASHGSHGLDNVASQLFNVPAMKKRSDNEMNHIISRIATANPQVSRAFAANTSGAGRGNLTNTASSNDSSSTSSAPSSTSGQGKSKQQAESTGHHHGKASSTASGSSSSSSSSSPTSSSNSTSAKPTSASSRASGSSGAHQLSAEVLSSLATMSTSQMPEALSSLGMTQSVSLFAGMDPLAGFRSSSQDAKTSSSSPSSSQPSSSSSSSSLSPSQSSTSTSSSQPSSSSSSILDSTSASTHHHAGNATHARKNSTSAAKPTSVSSGSLTRSRGSGTRTSGSQSQSNDMSDILAQGILGDTGLSPSQVSQYYGSRSGHSSNSAQSSHSGHRSQGANSHGQGHMSASLHYQHGYQSVSQSL